MAEIKIDFVKRHIELIKQQLSKLNIELQIIDVNDFDQQAEALTEFCQQHQIKAIYANRDVELNENQRDQKIIDAGLPLTLLEADVMVSKGAVTNKEGGMYRVYSAFRRAWIANVSQFGFSVEDNPETINDIIYAEQEDAEKYEGLSDAWPLSSKIIADVIPAFLAFKIKQYHELRDIPGIKGTSGLSPYLAIGAVSVRRLLQQVINRYPDVLSQPESGAFSWLNELIWRDFYRHLLFHYPNLIKGESFNPKYQNLPWPAHHDHFEKWKSAQTGFPIVDAAMRQLQKTGWMHNRLRMIVGSFLTKNLLVDWHLGERYFMQQLIDGDFAANNGGWQWSAGTGCDAQPYFRVFNPLTQSKKFDPEGKFIRKYLPELADVPDKYIHAPYDYLRSIGQKDKYWPEIVDLKETRLAAIEFYGNKDELDN